jgi:hypothetical protein
MVSTNRTQGNPSEKTRRVWPHQHNRSVTCDSGLQPSAASKRQNSSARSRPEGRHIRRRALSFRTESIPRATLGWAERSACPANAFAKPDHRRPATTSACCPDPSLAAYGTQLARHVGDAFPRSARGRADDSGINRDGVTTRRRTLWPTSRPRSFMNPGDSTLRNACAILMSFACTAGLRLSLQI